MKKIVLTDTKKFDEFYDDWDLTFTGVIENEWNLYVDFIKGCSPINEDSEVYYFKGKLMNKKYNLKGKVAYNDDLGFLVIKMRDVESIDRIALPMRLIGGRWFNDIVDNNKRANYRQN